MESSIKVTIISPFKCPFNNIIHQLQKYDQNFSPAKKCSDFVLLANVAKRKGGLQGDTKQESTLHKVETNS